MQLGTERRLRIKQRLEPILKEFNPALQFITVFVDSAREYLGVVAQVEDQPLLLKFPWVEFISSSDLALREQVRSQLEQKLNHTKLQAVTRPLS
jgi:hypothetical protein